LQLKPDLAEAHNNLGKRLEDQGKLDEALACYHRALEIKPDFPDVRSNLVFTLQYRPGISLAELAEAHAEYDRRHAAPLRAKWRPHEPRGQAPRPLRLGFASPDFCQHPVGFFFDPALGNLDRQEAEIICYRRSREQGPAEHPRISSGRRALARRARWNHEQLATRIRDDQIDILFRSRRPHAPATAC